MPGEESLWDQITRVLSLFATSEVKTPLSFVFRMALYLAILLGLIVFAPASDDLKKWFVLVVITVFVLLCILILVCLVQSDELSVRRIGTSRRTKIDVWHEPKSSND